MPMGAIVVCAIMAAFLIGRPVARARSLSSPLVGVIVSALYFPSFQLWR